MKEKIINILLKLNKGLIEREVQIKIALLAILAEENVLFVGPPGTGKSQLSRKIASAFQNSSYFEYLLTKFTTPEELYGPISLKELENDKFHRNTQGYLTDSEIVFLDEVFKANSAILNSMLTIMNEKIYHNGYIKENIKTRAILAATNELPDENQGLDALYDRFIFKSKVNYVSDDEKLFFLENSFSEISFEEQISIYEIKKINSQIEKVILSQDVINKILNIKKKIFLEFGNEEIISDRRFVKSIRILKVAVSSLNRFEIISLDLLLFTYIFWKNEKNFSKIKDIIINEVLQVEDLELNYLEEIYKKWFSHFNSFFNEQLKNENGNFLYYDIDNDYTEKKRGLLHLRDSIGNYIFYKGNRDFVKILVELGKFDHGYIDTLISTKDNKKIWKYEFSSVEVVTNPNSYLNEYEKLTVESDLVPAMINSFEEYYQVYKNSKKENISVFKEILNNIKFEKKALGSIYSKLLTYLNELTENKDTLLWLPTNDLIDIEKNISQKISQYVEISSNYEKLIKNLERSINE